ncbi:MAG: hypothetical protein KKB51_15250 [Candidatus Riflebacteria bacterium]|nr:hypothetical protein [Candidatus Riflebacteria bacterium]
MRHTAKLVFLFALIAAAALPAHAQGWASVDTRLLMVLHPQMGNFDYSAARFFRQAFSPDRNEQLFQELNKATKEADKKLSIFRRKESAMLEKRADLLLERDETINDLSEKAASEAYNIRGKYERVAEYEKRYEEKLAALDRELKDLYLSIDAVKDEAYAPIYLTRQETTNRLSDIKRDVKNMTQQVAAQHGISVVFDSSFGLRPVKQEGKSANLYVQNDDFDVLSSSLFHDLLNFTVSPPPDAAQIGATTDHMLIGGAYAKLDTLRKITQLRSYLLPFAGEFTPGSIFLVGGNDITANVAQKIFEQYKIPETLKASYLMVIRDFLNVENSPYIESPPRYPDETHGGAHE